MIWDLVKQPWQAKTNILTNVTVVCRGTPPRKEGEGLVAVCQTSRRSSGGVLLLLEVGELLLQGGHLIQALHPPPLAVLVIHLCARETHRARDKRILLHILLTRSWNTTGRELLYSPQKFHLPLGAGGRQLIPNTGYIKPILTRDPQVLFIKISC